MPGSTAPGQTPSTEASGLAANETPAPQPQDEKSIPDWLAGLLGALFVGIIIAVSALQTFFRDPDVPSFWKVAVAVALIVVGLVSLVIGWKWLAQSFPAVAWFTNIVAFVVCVGIAVVPVFLFRRPDQIFFLKILVIVILSVLPGLLFLQFLVVRRQSLWEEFLYNLRRLGIDEYGPVPDPTTTSPVRPEGTQSDPAGTGLDLYTKKFEAIYGKTAMAPGDRRAHLQGESVVPMLVTTILLAVGWTLTLQPETIAGLRLLPEGLALSGRPLLPQEALRFGFAGSYFFILQMVVRRYYQDDLKANAYITAINRVVLVAILVVAVGLVLPAGMSEDTVAAVGFTIGVFPQIGLQIIYGAVSKLFSTLRLLRLEPDYPLNELDGITIWDEARLLEEGVEDLQNLASANLVDLMLRTRIPVERLVDWIDQAHLYLRLRPSKKANGQEDREKLRSLGIRTATDLDDVFRAKRHGVEPLSRLHGVWEEAISDKDDQDLRERLRDLKLSGSADGPSQLYAILKTLDNEPNLHHVRLWKQSRSGEYRTATP